MENNAKTAELPGNGIFKPNESNIKNVLWLPVRKLLLLPLYIVVKYVARPPRDKSLIKYTASLIDENSHVLDFGCNEGIISSAIKSVKPSITLEGLDIHNHNKCRIPVTIYDGTNAPFKDNHFEYVILLDVLHHTTDIKKVLAEAVRISKKYIIIKDHHIGNSKLLDWYLTFGDYMGNLPYNIKCVYNYPTMDWWHDTFEEMSLIVTDKITNQDYGYYSTDNVNFIYKLEKQNTSKLLKAIKSTKTARTDKAKTNKTTKVKKTDKRF